MHCQLLTESASGISLKPLVTQPPSPCCEVSVVVPVRDEAETLVGTLAALADQIDLAGNPLGRECYEIILLANNCSDDSVAIAQSFAKHHPTLALHVVEVTLPAAEAYIGRVRRILMDEACRRLLSLGRRRGVIASTDGDTQVAPTWIAATLEEVACGAEAVGGRILLEPAGRLTLDTSTQAYHLREVGYRYLIAELETYLDPDLDDPWPRHYQHFGASLAVTAQMYEQVGGLPPVRSSEDVAFYRALVRANARFRHSPKVRVMTSARQTGRTSGGLANQLSNWAAMGRAQPFLVEPAAAIETRLRSRHKLRMLWRQLLKGHQPIYQDIKLLANHLGVAPEWLITELALPHSFGLLLEQIEQRQRSQAAWVERWPLVPIEQAIRALRLRLDCFRRSQNTNSGGLAIRKSQARF